MITTISELFLTVFFVFVFAIIPHFFVFQIPNDYNFQKLSPLFDINKSLNSENPCESFFNDFRYIFITDDWFYNLQVIRKAKCFEDENYFMNAIDFAFRADSEISLLEFFIPLAVELGYKKALSKIFGLCVFGSKYFCIQKLLKIDPLLSCHGNNILHYAALLDDEDLFGFIPENIPLLHIRNQIENGKVPSKFVSSPKMIELFELRLTKEIEFSPFPKEISAHIAHLKKYSNSELSLKCLQSIVILLFERTERPENPEGELRIKVNRDKIFKCTFDNVSKLVNWYSINNYYKYFIRFTDEEAIDQGGVTIEWFSLLLESFLKSNPDRTVEEFTLPLFQPIDEYSHLYVPTNYYPPEVYKFAGSIVAAALENQIPTGVEFIPSFYRILLGIEPFRLDDLDIQDPEMSKRLKLLLMNSEEAEKARKLLDLTLNQVPEYVLSRSMDTLYYRYKESLEAFAVGFRSRLKTGLVLHEYLDLYELHLILRGRQDFNFQEFKNSFNFVNPISARHIYEFWAVLSTLTQEQCFKLVKFITGRRHLPFGGMSSKMNVYFRAFDQDKLPCASTCTNTLYMPRFDLADQIKRPLIFAIENCDTLSKE